MVSLSYDFHIHSCLSPCAEDDMTPANIAGMALIKGLDVIAVTDHNSCKNCPAVLEAAKSWGILALPGMEINTREEIHAVCLFPELEQAMDFDQLVYTRLLPVPNHEKAFGKQQIYNTQDQISGTEPLLLIQAADISIDDLWDLVCDFGGVMFPAHLDKPSNSLLVNLGFIPPDSRFRTAEIRDLSRLHSLRTINPYLKGCQIVTNSDAHNLGDIQEPEHRIFVQEKTAKALIAALKEPVI